MGLETATKISELVATNPIGTDPKSQGDDHLRLIKSVLKADALSKADDNITSGTYTPVLTNNSNCAALSVPGPWQYLRVGNVVTVSGFASCNCTAATNTTFFITLPAASQITNTLQGCGVAYANITSGRTVGGINTEASGNRANCFFVALVPGQHEVNCHFTYQVLS